MASSLNIVIYLMYFNVLLIFRMQWQEIPKWYVFYLIPKNLRGSPWDGFRGGDVRGSYFGPDLNFKNLFRGPPLPVHISNPLLQNPVSAGNFFSERAAWLSKWLLPTLLLPDLCKTPIQELRLNQGKKDCVCKLLQLLESIHRRVQYLSSNKQTKK